MTEIYPDFKRKYVDLSTMTLNGQVLPARYVDSKIIWENEDPNFAHIVQDLKESPKPGYFLTRKGKGDKKVNVRWGLNRHGITEFETFRDKHGRVYRDIDDKGIGYSRGYPMFVIPVRLPEMRNDHELRGLREYDSAKSELDNTIELYEKGFRVVPHIALVELFELVDKNGDIVPRKDVIEEFH